MNRKKILLWILFSIIICFFAFRWHDSQIKPVVPKVVFAPTGTLSLVTEPKDGIAPVLSLIENAKTSIDIVMYEFEDGQIEQALAAAQNHGVSVRVLLNEGYYGAAEKDNQDAYAFFKNNNVPVEWTPAYFALTHQKTLVVDGDEAFIMTFNFTPQYYKTSRDFGIDDKSLADVTAVENTFNADWSGNKVNVPAGNDLVWSPNARPEMLALIASATSTLEIYNEEMADTKIISALSAAAERGVDVEIDMTYSSDWKDAFQTLTDAGVHIRTYSAKAPLYIHAKVILVDGATAFVGSQNFSSTSLDDNRELGIVLNDPNIIHSLDQTFQSDWQNATPFAVQ